MSEEITEIPANTRVRLPQELGGGWAITKFTSSSGNWACWIPGPEHSSGWDSGFLAYVPTQFLSPIVTYSDFDEAVVTLKADLARKPDTLEDLAKTSRKARHTLDAILKPTPDPTVAALADLARAVRELAAAVRGYRPMAGEYGPERLRIETEGQ